MSEKCEGSLLSKALKVVMIACCTLSADMSVRLINTRLSACYPKEASVVGSSQATTEMVEPSRRVILKVKIRVYVTSTMIKFYFELGIMTRPFKTEVSFL